MIQELFSQNRLFSILHEELTEKVGADHPLLCELMDYVDLYARVNRVTVETAEASYLKFIAAYRKDVLEFVRTGHYPTGGREIARVEYDLALLLSTVLTWPRFRIMQLLAERALSADRTLFVGVGSGVELHLLRHRVKNAEAFDLRINPFLRELMPSVAFREEEFKAGKGLYGQIFLIEILEHLDDPFHLVSQCGRSLQVGGQIHLTTATNIPQFDHRANFPKDHCAFEAFLREQGCQILFCEDIPHPPAPKDVGSQNRFYTLVRR